MVKKCKICQKDFIPGKFHPNQSVCQDPSCQHQRQLLNQRLWRRKNPNYFRYRRKNTSWERRRAQYLRVWRKAHREYFKGYYQRIKRQKQKFALPLDIGG